MVLVLTDAAALLQEYSVRSMGRLGAKTEPRGNGELKEEH